MKTLLRLFALLALALFASVTFAAESVADTATAVADATAPWIGNLVTSHPWIATVLVIIGALRVVAKPLMSLAHAWAAATASTRDDAIVERVEASWAWRAFCWLLDWTASVKIGTQRPVVGPPAETPATGTPANPEA